jgi:hypothetical protein
MKSSYVQLSFSVITLVICGVIYSVWYGYVANESGMVASLAAQVKAKTETKARASALANALTELAKNETSVQGYFVTESNIVPFLEFLQSTGTRLGATVKIPSVGANTNVKQPALVISLQITGTFDAVMRTVGAIEFAPYAISVTSLLISQTGETATASWNASMSITVGSNAPIALPKKTPTLTPPKNTPPTEQI